jgi:hypothetical protein
VVFRPTAGIPEGLSVPYGRFGWQAGSRNQKTTFDRRLHAFVLFFLNDRVSLILVLSTQSSDPPFRVAYELLPTRPARRDLLVRKLRFEWGHAALVFSIELLIFRNRYGGRF